MISNKTAIKNMLIFVVAAIVLLFSPVNALSKSGYASFSPTENEAYVFKLPSSLLSIEDEAFFGTAPETVIFQQGLLNIGERTFIDAPHLETVYIPDSVEYIHGETFPESVLIHGVAGSYAQMWAEACGFIFVADDIWHYNTTPIEKFAELLLSCLFCVILIDIRFIKKFIRRTVIFERSMRPQDRIDLYPINYKFP